MTIRNLIAGFVTLLLISACGSTPPAPHHSHGHSHVHGLEHGHVPQYAGQSQRPYQIAVRPVGNPRTTPPPKYPDFLAKVGGLQLSYLRNDSDKAYIFRTRPTTLAEVERTIERLKSHPYIRYAKINRPSHKKGVD